MNKTELLKIIAEESGISVEDIAGVYTNEENGEHMIFKRNQLVNQLQKICPVINSSFDEIYEDEFKKISSEISEILPILFVGYKHAQKDKEELFITCGDLLRNSSNTIIAAVQTLRCGFRLQSGILLRSVIEICATVVHLITIPEDLTAFLNDELKSTKSISIANKLIPLFGRAWGILSNKHIHINSLHAEWYPLKEFKDKKEITTEVTLGVIGLVTIILRITTELTFYSNVDEHTFWKSEGENKVSFIPPSDDITKWIREKLDDK